MTKNFAADIVTQSFQVETPVSDGCHSWPFCIYRNQAWIEIYIMNLYYSWDDGLDDVVRGCWELEEFGIEEETVHKHGLIWLITESLSHHQVSIDKNGLKEVWLICRLSIF